MNKHTPTPWNLNITEDMELISISSTYRKVIAHAWDKEPISDEDIANAQFIVKAVNCHDELVEALKTAHEYLRQCCLQDKEHWIEVEQALKKAEE